MPTFTPPTRSHAPDRSARPAAPRRRLAVIAVAAIAGATAPAGATDVPFIQRAIDGAADGAWAVALADLDGDGDLDVLSASRIGDEIAWYENDGARPPAFTKRVITAALNGANDVLAADLDGDGDLDVLASAFHENEIGWYENDGGAPPAFFARSTGCPAFEQNALLAFDAGLDGDLDVFVATASAGAPIRWHRNDGGAPPAFFCDGLGIEDSVRSLASADLNGDGQPDLASGSSGAIIWYPFFGNDPGVERFVDDVVDVRSLEAADLDGDGDPDLLAVDAPARLVWYEHDGSAMPVFTARPIDETLTDASDAHAADLDGDGDLDVAVVDAGGHAMIWYESDGGAPPSFTVRPIETGGLTPMDVHAGDLDGDGDLDLVSAWADSNEIVWHENTANVLNLRTDVAYATIAGAIADAMSGDDLLAIQPDVFAAEPEVDFAGKAITLASVAEIAQPEGGTYVLAQGGALASALGFEIDLAGALVAPAGADATVAADALSVGGAGAIRVETAAGLFVTADGGASITGDVDLAPNANATISGPVTASPAATGAIIEHLVDETAANFSPPIAVDLDGDGDRDIVCSDEGELVWFENDGLAPPSFARRAIQPDFHNISDLGTADMDGDGDPDILVTQHNDATVSWFESDGQRPPAFVQHVVSSTLGSARTIDAGDIDGDGDQDLACAGSNLVVWYESDGAAPPTYTLHEIDDVSEPNAIAAVDLDADGDLDVVISGDQIVRWYESNGAADPSFAPRLIGTSVSAAEVLPADLDEDGDLDLVAGAADGLVWLEHDGQPDPGFTEHVVSNAPTLHWSVSVLDADADGALDLVYGLFPSDGSNDTVVWALGDGGASPAFTPRAHDAGDIIGKPHAADLDGDGVAEVILRNRHHPDPYGLKWLELETSSTRLASGSALVLDAGLTNRRALGAVNATLAASGPIANESRLTLHGGAITAGGGLVNDGVVEGFGLLDAFVTNDGSVLIFADTQVLGDYDNAGVTTIQGGTLTILGTLTNTGEIVGDFFASGGGAAAAEDGLFVQGGLVIGADAALRVPHADATIAIGGDFDVAIDDAARFDLSQAELRLTGSGDHAIELLSADIGADAEGLERGDGRFPIGSLRVGAGATVVLVDAHDNDGQGQAIPEALYVSSLVVEEGAALITNGQPVYFEAAQIDGQVDDPAALEPIEPDAPCPADLDGTGDVGFSDLLAVLAARGPCEGDCPEDLDGDGIVGFADLVIVLAAWGARD